MNLLERFWSKVTTITTIFIFSGSQDVGQTPFSFPSDLSQIGSAISTGHDGPVFSPPGIPRESQFECKYPAMVGWESCSTSYDRKCWLRETATGKQFDINTNYEDAMPIGITRYYNLTLEDGWYAADGLNFTSAKLFREDGKPLNQYPGPWIEACWGDKIIVNVTNNLYTSKNGTSVHWHGIRQNQTMQMDGVNGVTQCPIAPGDHFVYEFTAVQYGSSWYHSHYSVQYADGAVGPMTLHGPTSTEFDEAISPPLILTDWGHNTAFVAVSTGKQEHPDILLNGRGNVTSFDNKVQNETAIKAPYHITFEGPMPGRFNKKYLIRVINTSFDTTFRFSIDNHLLQVVSADFVPIQPYHSQSILIGIGQRYNVIVEATPQVTPDTGALDPEGNYWIRTEVVICFNGNKEGSPGYEKTGVLRYNTDSTANPTTEAWHKVPENCRDENVEHLVPILQWNVNKPSISSPGKDKKGDRFEFWRDPDAGQEYYPLAKWSLGDKDVFSPLRVDYLNPTFFNLDLKEDQWPPLWNIVTKQFTDGEWIYMVFEGNGTGQGAHPIHLHGHDFAILEQAYNKVYDEHNVSIVTVNPPRRDVVLLPNNGYIIIAFKADNPGAWLVHCHIAFHISEGLGLQIMEDQIGARKLWPSRKHGALKEAARVCKNWNDWYDDLDNWAVPPSSPLCKYKDNPDWCFQDDSGV